MSIENEKKEFHSTNGFGYFVYPTLRRKQDRGSEYALCELVPDAFVQALDTLLAYYSQDAVQCAFVSLRVLVS